MILGSPGINSDMYIRPVDLEMWKRDGKRLVKHMMYVMKVVDASCNANCFRIVQSSYDVFIVLVMY